MKGKESAYRLIFNIKNKYSQVQYFVLILVIFLSQSQDEDLYPNFLYFKFTFVSKIYIDMTYHADITWTHKDL